MRNAKLKGSRRRLHLCDRAIAAADRAGHRAQDRSGRGVARATRDLHLLAQTSARMLDTKLTRLPRDRKYECRRSARSFRAYPRAYMKQTELPQFRAIDAVTR
jgi:hypothetical protein